MYKWNTLQLLLQKYFTETFHYAIEKNRNVNSFWTRIVQFNIWIIEIMKYCSVPFLVWCVVLNFSFCFVYDRKYKKLGYGIGFDVCYSIYLVVVVKSYSSKFSRIFCVCTRRAHIQPLHERSYMYIEWAKHKHFIRNLLMFGELHEFLGLVSAIEILNTNSFS